MVFYKNRDSWLTAMTKGESINELIDVESRSKVVLAITMGLTGSIDQSRNIHLSQIRFQEVWVFKYAPVDIVSAKDFILYIKIVHLVAYHSEAAITLFANKGSVPEDLQLLGLVQLLKIIYSHDSPFD